MPMPARYRATAFSPLSQFPGCPPISAPTVRRSCSAAKLFERLLRSCTTTASGAESWVAMTRSPCAGEAHVPHRDPAPLEQLAQRLPQEQRRLRDPPVDRARVGAQLDAPRDVDARLWPLFLGVDAGGGRSIG